MLARLLPRHVPPLGTLLADLGHPSAAELAQALGVSRRTVYRWLRADHAPRPVMLSLFWVTRWGRSEIDCRAVNDAAQAHAMLKLYQQLADQRRGQLAKLLDLGGFGSANDPLIELDSVRRRVR